MNLDHAIIIIKASMKMMKCHRKLLILKMMIMIILIHIPLAIQIVMLKTILNI